MNDYKFSLRSRDNLYGVHTDLIIVATYALTISMIDFVVIEGVRTRARQKKMVNSGASQTMNSRHLTGHAIDMAAIVDGEVRWDWPLYSQIAAAMKQSAKRFDVPIEWGGDWVNLKDGPHFQLSWKHYPYEADYET